MTIVRRISIVVVTLLLILTLAVGGWLIWIIRAPMPVLSGTFRVSGLRQPADVYRDSWGVPNIYAENSHDLFLVQGYVHAQDRFAQMEFSRRFAAGRLSEVFGAATLDADRFVRTMGWPRVVDKEVILLDDETRSILQAYADGVNAYLVSHDNLGLEFELLGVQGIKYMPEPWTIADTLGWLKVMALNMDGNVF